MEKSGYIWRNPDESVGLRRYIFTTFVQNCHMVLLELFRHAGSMAKTTRGYDSGRGDCRRFQPAQPAIGRR
jgi:hypothetical protein